VLVEQQPAKQHAERRHQEVIGARRGRPDRRQQLEPDQEAHHRNQQPEIGDCDEQPPAWHDVRHRFEAERKGHECQPASQVLHAVADPQRAFRRKPFEQNRSADERDQRRHCESDAGRAVEPNGDPAFHDEGDAAETKQEASRLPPGHLFLEEHGGKHCRQHRIGADDERRQTGRDAPHADVVEAKIDRIVRNAEKRKNDQVTP
jgi:hypothetical protein